MIIGCLELPNKWTGAASINGGTFTYINACRWPNMNEDTWGGGINVIPGFRCFKVISQEGLRLSEYWCVMLSGQPELDGILVPIAMKRYGYHNIGAKCFVFKGGIAQIRSHTPQVLYNQNGYMHYNSSTSNTFSCAEYFLMGVEENEAWPHWSNMYREIINSGRDMIPFKSGEMLHISDLLHRCTMIESYAKNTIHRIDECGDPHDFGLTTNVDLMNYFKDYIPMDPGYQALELDYIGECILKQNLDTFPIQAIEGAMMRTPATRNTMSMLHEASQREELVIVENLQNGSLSDAYTDSSTCDDIQEEIDELVNLFCIDEATTYAFIFTYGQPEPTQIIERIFGYGESSKENYRDPHALDQTDQMEFIMQHLCEILGASKIRCIKTFNEELFITIWFDNGNVQSYYYNLFVHLCVTGVLFTL